MKIQKKLPKKYTRSLVNAMPYDELLSSRIRAALGPLSGLIEKKMFGGVGFMVNGNPSAGSGQAWPAESTKTT